MQAIAIYVTCQQVVIPNYLAELSRERIQPQKQIYRRVFDTSVNEKKQLFYRAV